MKAALLAGLAACVPAVLTVTGFYIATQHPDLHLAFCQGG